MEGVKSAYAARRADGISSGSDKRQSLVNQDVTGQRSVLILPTRIIWTEHMMIDCLVLDGACRIGEYLVYLSAQVVFMIEERSCLRAQP